MKKQILTAWAALLPALLIAEEIQNPMSLGLARLVQTFNGNALEAAEAMPESDYGFRPAPEARSFGEIVSHLADGNRTFCAVASGRAHPVDPRSERKARKDGGTKEALIAELRSSLEPCDAVLEELDDAKLSRMVPFGGGQLIDGRAVPESELSLSTVLTIQATHTSLHYGNMTTYLRMKNIVPPSSRDIAR